MLQTPRKTRFSPRIDHFSPLRPWSDFDPGAENSEITRPALKHAQTAQAPYYPRQPPFYGPTEHEKVRFLRQSRILRCKNKATRALDGAFSRARLTDQAGQRHVYCVFPHRRCTALVLLFSKHVPPSFKRVETPLRRKTAQIIAKEPPAPPHRQRPKAGTGFPAWCSTPRTLALLP